MRRMVIFFLVILFSLTANAGWKWTQVWTAQDMCKYIPQEYSTEQAHLFFDAQDKTPIRTTYSKITYFTFPIVSQSNGETVHMDKLGDLFHGRKERKVNVIGNYKLWYREAITEKGRVLTKIYNFPRHAPDYARIPSWSIYKLCRSENCEGGIAKGEWEKVTSYIDEVPMQSGDVFAFYYNMTRKPPKLECVTEPVHVDTLRN